MRALEIGDYEKANGKIGFASMIDKILCDENLTAVSYLTS